MGRLTFLAIVACAGALGPSCGGGAGPRDDDGAVDGDADADAGPDGMDAAADDAGSPADGGVDGEVADGGADAEVDVGPDAAVVVLAPLYEEVALYETVLPRGGMEDDDATDVYYPSPPGLAGGGYSFPVAILLQGARVDRSHYVGFAETVASYGFIVLVPNHYSTTLLGRGLFAEQSEVPAALERMVAENEDPASPLFGAVDTSSLLVMGHSYGGVTGLDAVREVCRLPTCVGGFTRPPELVGAAFWGTNMVPPWGGAVPDIHNDGIPVALVQGDLDSMAPLGAAERTFAKIQDGPKALVVVSGANHYGQCDVDNPEGAQRDSTAPTLAQDLSVETIGRWTATFLRAYALDDAEARVVMDTLGAHDPNVTITLE